ncbi:hypothetical protein JHK82_034046 [Glycine max]|nr:hypothetical protein JHK85_034755 [Glycine max]KAG4986425.1 hypothetical protein JHK86_034116 [Glycine max]KAG5119626.1 hypothetical protein JHK82_034046 [Glycine max]KAG5140614.1 hypothetical protein JHK84_034382 [Glycine max]
MKLRLWEENVKRLGFSKAAAARPVQWFTREPAATTTRKAVAAKRVREGVEFYSNGDFYEGVFHKGRSNGSGVYHYFVNGRYEGDWVDGRYDGYEIESWARGSRYRGQYRQGLRHGYGVYRFYTGDSYSGEWCNDQSHGVGLQTCSDASCYIGQFKYGVKHGSLTISDIKQEMEKTLHWLVLIATSTVKAHHGFGWVGEWARIGSELNKKTMKADVMRIETLHHADKDKVKNYILELLIWLHRLAIKSKDGIDTRETRDVHDYQCFLECMQFNDTQSCKLGSCNKGSNLNVFSLPF